MRTPGSDLLHTRNGGLRIELPWGQYKVTENCDMTAEKGEE